MTWHIDRSRIEAGRACPRKRVLTYSIAIAEHPETKQLELSGYGIGIVPKGKAIALETGTHVHAIFEGLLKAAAAYENEFGVPADAAALAAAAAPAIAVETKLYREQAATFMKASPERSEEILKEQCWLVECLGWLLALRVLPNLLETFAVVSSEREEEISLSDGRITMRSRPDALLRHRNSARLLVFDLKTTGDIDSRLWTAQWEVNPQLLAAAAIVQQRLLHEHARLGGEADDCSSYYVLGLEKGKYEADWTPAGGEKGPKKQQSPLCYAYLRNLGLSEREWRPSYWIEIVDEQTGEVRREGATERRGWNKVAVFEQGIEARAFVEELLSQGGFLDTLWRLIGPIECDPSLVDSWFVGVEAEEETRWIPLAAALAAGATGPALRRLLDEAAPHNWSACFSYGMDYACSFRRVCLGEAGALEEFEPRVPHHPGELSGEG